MIGIYLAVVSTMILVIFAIAGVASGVRAMREGDPVWGILFMAYTVGGAAVMIPLLWVMARDAPL